MPDCIIVFVKNPSPNQVKTRLLPLLSPEQAARLATLYAATNPRQLREDIYRAIDQLWSHAEQRKEAASSR